MPDVPLRLAVIGDPVAHSLSPQLHRGFFEERNIEGSYEALRVPAGDGRRVIAALRARGYHGLNVTTPLKEEAFAASQTRDAAARASGAVNTLVFGKRIAGYNTDGAGALGALRAAGLASVKDVRILVLGAGPAARAAIAALTSAGSRIVVWNRAPARIEPFANAQGARLWQPGAPVDALFAALAPGARFDDAALLQALRAAPIAVDANYGPRATLAAVLERSDVCDGTAMLRASARASFELFLTAVP